MWYTWWCRSTLVQLMSDGTKPCPEPVLVLWYSTKMNNLTGSSGDPLSNWGNLHTAVHYTAHTQALMLYCVPEIYQKWLPCTETKTIGLTLKSFAQPMQELKRSLVWVSIPIVFYISYYTWSIAMENRKACLVNARDQDSWHHHCPTAFTSLPKYLANDVWLHKPNKIFNVQSTIATNTGCREKS